MMRMRPTRFFLTAAAVVLSLVIFAACSEEKDAGDAMPDKTGDTAAASSSDAMKKDGDAMAKDGDTMMKKDGEAMMVKAPDKITAPHFVDLTCSPD